MALDPASRVRFNLDRAVILLLDDTEVGMSILVQIVTGLGAKDLYRCATVEKAQEIALKHRIDLAIVDSLSPSGAGYDFVKWLRTSTPEPSCYTPVLLTTAHTPARDVNKARDCGGHIIVKKPIAPIVILERIIWMSKEGRPFLYSDGYVGPDRRFHDDGPPDGVGRRRGDVAETTVNVAQEPSDQ
jgi:response regulator RpfG family c-di-GMP phosphodiesterase